MSTASIVEIDNELDKLKELHRIFYREYVESENANGIRDISLLVIALETKARYYRLRGERPKNYLSLN